MISCVPLVEQVIENASAKYCALLEAVGPGGGPSSATYVARWSEAMVADFGDLIRDLYAEQVECGLPSMFAITAACDTAWRIVVADFLMDAIRGSGRALHELTGDDNRRFVQLLYRTLRFASDN